MAQRQAIRGILPPTGVGCDIAGCREQAVIDRYCMFHFGEHDRRNRRIRKRRNLGRYEARRQRGRVAEALLVA
jgi:hypothetical protein